MLSTIIIIISSYIIDNLVSGQIGLCINKYEHESPINNEGATWCADEGGSCSGPGRVYYGSALTWTYADLVDGESKPCSNNEFGCDPLVAFTKKCYIKKDTRAVGVLFAGLKILKTNDDGSNGDSTEEWNIVNSGTTPQITMNVDFIDPDETWSTCNYDIPQIYHEEGDEGQNDVPCHPPANTEDSDGFYDCVIGGHPIAVVRPSVYESGLKYTFNFQMGDYDANGVFDNGPVFDFTYTEPDHRSITDLKNAFFPLTGTNGIIERYFTRTGSDGRKARVYVHYLYVDNYEKDVDFDGNGITFCN